MKIKKYTNGAWTDLDKPVKEFNTYTDEATSLPLTIETSKTDVVENYQVYGVSGGVGEATSGSEPAGFKIPILNTSGVTENLFDPTTITLGKMINIEGEINSAPRCYSDYIAVESNEIYYLVNVIGNQSYYSGVAYDEQKNAIKNIQAYGSTVLVSGKILTPENTKWIRINTVTANVNAVMVVKGSTAPDHYIPHRYTSNYNLFVGDSKLYADEYLDFVEQKVYRYVDGVLTPQDPPTPFPTISTYIGENNLSVDTTVQPEKVAVEYEGWKGVGDVEKYLNGEWSDNNGT